MNIRPEDKDILSKNSTPPKAKRPTLEVTSVSSAVMETEQSAHSASAEADLTDLTEEISPPEETEPTAADTWTITRSIIREVVETVVLALIMVFLIQLVIRNFRVDGHSMEPNLHHGQYLVVDKISYKLPFNLRSPQRGDVVVFSPPTQPNKDFVKRIIGLPDDTVEIKRGKVYINGEPLPNTFEARLDRTSMGPRTVPEGELFVMGDNRANSNDSRNWGMLEMDEVVGKAWLSYWPPQTWGVIPNDTSAASATLKSLFQQKEVEP